MKTENKIAVLDHISPEMQQVLQYQRDNPPAAPEGSDYPAQRRAYSEERRYWNAGAPAMPTQDVDAPTPYGSVRTRIYAAHKNSPATLFYLHGGGFVLGNLDTHDRIMRLLAQYTRCTVVGIDYTLSPEARFPQAIEEAAAVCQFYAQHAANYRLNMQRIGFAGDSAGAMLALATPLWLRDRAIHCGQVMGVLLYYGLYGLQDSRSRRLYGGPWDGLTREDLQSYDRAYLRDEQDRESPYYCLFNNDLTRDVPPCFIASAEYDPLIDDSKTLYAVLQAHQHASRYQMYPGTLHAFLHYSRMMETADRALRDGARFFCENNR
jgi:acetyl esterase